MALVNERSDRVWESTHEASQKFDYFMAAMSAALTAFVAQGLPSRPPRHWSTFLEAASAALLAVSVGFAVERLRANTTALLANHRWLYYNEAKGRLVALLAKGGGTHLINESTGETFSLPEARQRVASLAQSVSQYENERERWDRKARRFYTVRDVALLLGLLLYVASRVATAFF